LEKRIYSVSPAVITPGDGSVKIVQPLGRQAAQLAHAVGKVRFDQARRAIDSVDYETTTTILLDCRDSYELYHVIGLLNRARILNELFYDKNDEAYGPIGNILTAVATHPVDPKKVYHILGYLPLFLEGINR
jgi:Peptidyl-tRNA hydrolase PTH2